MKRMRIKPKSKVEKISLVIAIFVFLLGCSVVAAHETGRGNFLSNLARILPIEQVSLLNSVRKPNQQLISEAIINDLSFDKVKQLKGEEVKLLGQFELAGEVASSSMKFNAKVGTKADVAMSPDGKTMKAHYELGGKFSAGIFNIDLGNDGIQMDLMVPKEKEMYGKLHLSDQVKDTFKPVFSNGDPRGMAKVEKFLDQYFLVNFQEINALNEEMGKKKLELLTGNQRSNAVNTATDPKKVTEATEALKVDLAPDLHKFAADTVKKIAQVANVTTLPRETVAGRSAMVFGLDIKKGQLPDALLQSITELINLLEHHQAAIMKYCDAATPVDIYAPDCDENFKTFKKNITGRSELDQAFIKQRLDVLLNYVTFENVKVYIDPVDNTLLKSEFTVRMSPDNKIPINSMQVRISDFKFTFIEEEVTRGKKVEVFVPPEAPNLTTEMRNFMEEKFAADKKLIEEYKSNPGLKKAPVYK